MPNIITTILNNKHTSIAGVIYLVVKLAAQIATIWFPDHAKQWDSTVQVVEAFAVTYGLVAAGDASKSATKKQVAEAIETGDTSQLVKPTETK